MSFYQSLNDVDGIVVLGGGESTMIAGLVAMGHGIPILALAGFGGKAAKVWEALRPGRDLPSADEISLMARPEWTDGQAVECVKVLTDQMQRQIEIERVRRMEELRKETAVSLHAAFALLLFVLSVLSVPIAWGWQLSQLTSIWLLFMSPLLAGVAGSTIRLVFDLRQGTAVLTSQSVVTTAA